MADQPGFAVVIPTLNEESRIEETVAAVRRSFHDIPANVYVADGGSDDDTAAIARRCGCRVLVTARGRGLQLRAGADAAMENLGDDAVLVFLHADTILPPEAGKALVRHYTDPSHDIALFRARFDHQSLVLRTYAWFTRFESFWTSFGDQVITTRKGFYRKIGGFPPWRSFEDVELLRNARYRTRIRRIPIWVTTSSRMFSAVGQVRQQLRNLMMMIRFRIGVSPERLYKDYYRPLHGGRRENMGYEMLKKGMSAEEISERIEDLIEELTLDEKVYMMSGHGFMHQFTELDNRRWGARTYQAGGGNGKRGIPSLQFSDGPRGIVTKDSTCFPVSMARGATWDTELEERVGDAIGRELRAHGGNLYGGVCINLLRHPAWGRAQETYGEDPYQLGEFGAALVRGVQKHNVIATVKHFAANSIENARFKVNVKIDERTLREVYLPHFKRCVDEGVGSIMSAYNKLNGEFCGQNDYLLNKILRTDWHFQGFVHSDWLYGVRATYAATHGLDIENPEPNHFGKKLEEAVKNGCISPDVVDRAVRRILSVLFTFLTREDPQTYDQSHIACPEHALLAREVAEKSMVLLTNTGSLLPLSKHEIQRIAVIGSLADVENTGDHGSSRVHPPYAVSPLQGLQDYLGNSVDVDSDTGTDIGSAARKAAHADAVVLVVGYTFVNEGEYIPEENADAVGGDRKSLALPERDVELIRAVAHENPHTIVVVVGGSAVTIDEWKDEVPAVLMSWYSGMEGGAALARILFGEVNPSGKLPCVFASSEDQLPFFDPDADEITYDFYHGYRLFDKRRAKPAFDFGHGLSYTTFEYSNFRLNRSEIRRIEEIEVNVDITNTGSRAGDEVYQLYIGYRDSGVERHVKDLKGFGRISLEAGETGTASISIRGKDLAYYDVGTADWVVEPITYIAYIGGSSRADALFQCEFTVTAQ